MTTGVAGAYRTLAIHDLDGTTTGMADSYILLHDGENDSVATDNSCKIEKTWNASVCKGDVGRMNIGGAGGPGRGGVSAVVAAAPRALAVPVRALLALEHRPGSEALVVAELLLPELAVLPQVPRRVRRRWNSPAARRPHRDGKDIRLAGNGATLKAGTEIKVKTERPEFSLSLSEMELGSWVVFELPGFAKADSAKQQDSLDALRKASETSYFKDKDSLWVKVVVATPPAVPAMPLQQQASVRVSR